MVKKITTEHFNAFKAYLTRECSQYINEDGYYVVESSSYDDKSRWCVFGIKEAGV